MRPPLTPHPRAPLALVPRTSAPLALAPLALAVLALASLPGCDLVDPLQREGTWRPSHAMDANIAAQITRPSTLVRGVEYVPLDGSMGTSAVDRYRSGRLKTLPDVNTGQIRNTPSGGGDTNGGAAATGGTAGQAQ